MNHENLTFGLFVVLLFLAFGYGVFMGKHGLNDYLHLKNQKITLSENMNQLRAEITRLRAESHMLLSANEVAHLAHEDINLLKANEILIVFNREKPTAAQ